MIVVNHQTRFLLAILRYTYFYYYFSLSEISWITFELDMIIIIRLWFIYVLNPEIRHSTQRSEGILELQPSPLVSLRPVIRFFTYNNMVWSKYWISFVCKYENKILKRELLFSKL